MVLQRQRLCFSFRQLNAPAARVMWKPKRCCAMRNIFQTKRRCNYTKFSCRSLRLRDDGKLIRLLIRLNHCKRGEQRAQHIYIVLKDFESKAFAAHKIKRFKQEFIVSRQSVLLRVYRQKFRQSIKRANAISCRVSDS